ncbi:MAG: exopolyphosphatase [Flavobacteriales bacterium]|nr:exopolyphosphatase [Flavobacteriales bacterium]
MRFAAIDIGSNAVRMLFCDVYPYQNDYVIKKTSLVRLPIRLGEDVFIHKVISDTNIRKLAEAATAFKNLVQVYDAVDFRVCATSAMREAENGQEVIKVIKQHAGIQVDIIDGETEAELLYQTHVAEKIDKDGTFLYMDVGGGSSEFTLFCKNEKVKSKSFRIGTIRLKNDLVQEETWNDMKKWLKKIREEYRPTMIIATGGNINKLYKLCGLKDYKPFEYEELKQMNKFIEKYSVEERVEKLGLKPDRADVITHAAKIYLTAMKSVDVKELFVPKVGLADGIIYELYQKHVLESIQKEIL